MKMNGNISDGCKNRDFRLVARFTSETVQDRATVTAERHSELVCNLWNGAHNTEKQLSL